MKKLNIYDKEKKIDKAWFDSSTILYGECNDKENDFKTVKIIFKNGTQYLYLNVDVNDWIKFRESTSQGKAINQYISKKDPSTKKAIYEYRRLEDIDTSLINEEYDKLTNKPNEDVTELEYVNISPLILKEIFSDVLEKNNITEFENITKEVVDELNKIANENKCNIRINIKYNNEPK